MKRTSRICTMLIFFGLLLSSTGWTTTAGQNVGRSWEEGTSASEKPGEANAPATRATSSDDAWDPSWENDATSIPDHLLMSPPASLTTRQLHAVDRGLEKKTMSLTKLYSLANDGEHADIEQKLRQTIDQHFTVRQAVREREILELEQKIAALRVQLQQREKARVRIVNGRVEQLARSARGLGWDGIEGEPGPSSVSPSAPE